MGLYDVNCPECGTKHKWFSGNADQRCSECRGEDSPTFANLHVEGAVNGDTITVTNIQPEGTVAEDKPKSRKELHEEKAKALKEEMQSRKAAKALKRRQGQLQKAADKFKRKRKKSATEHTPMRDLKEFDSHVQAQKLDESDKSPAGVPMKIIPDIERLIFPYYIAGASIRSIHQQFGEKFGFGLGALYTARDFYKWDQRRNAIRGVVLNDTSLQMAERVKDYLAFFDDLLSEAMIRFNDNSTSGQNKNPFNTLKVTNIKDMKDLTELMMNLANGGVKKVEIENKNGIKISDKKAERLLEILAEDDESSKE